MNDKNKKRVRNLLEDCETSMVNGEKCLLNYSSVKKITSPEHIQQKDLYNFVIGKRSKNDFKDDVKYFMNYFVKLGYLLLKNKTNPNILNIAMDKLY